MLGRPWNSQHRSICAKSLDDGSIRSRGYLDWVVDGDGRYQRGVPLTAESSTFGPEINLTGWTVLDGKGRSLIRSLLPRCFRMKRVLLGMFHGLMGELFSLDRVYPN